MPRVQTLLHLSYVEDAARGPGIVAAAAESRKKTEYSNPHVFTPVAIETSGVFGPAFIKELGRRLGQVTGDERSHQHLVQRLSIALLRGNAADLK